MLHVFCSTQVWFDFFFMTVVACREATRVRAFEILLRHSMSHAELAISGSNRTSS
jgi:hypothetical protein